MTKDEMTVEEKRLRRNNLIVAGILAAVALMGILIPLIHYTGLIVPQ